MLKRNAEQTPEQRPSNLIYLNAGAIGDGFTEHLCSFLRGFPIGPCQL